MRHVKTYNVLPWFAAKAKNLRRGVTEINNSSKMLSIYWDGRKKSGGPKKKTQNLDIVLSGWSTDGRITCQQAFAVAWQPGCTPSSFGEALDAHRIRIRKCQLGPFGYEPDKIRFDRVRR
jgi:hypothetical protein